MTEHTQILRACCLCAMVKVSCEEASELRPVTDMDRDSDRPDGERNRGRTRGSESDLGQKENVLMTDELYKN